MTFGVIVQPNNNTRVLTGILFLVIGTMGAAIIYLFLHPELAIALSGKERQPVVTEAKNLVDVYVPIAEIEPGTALVPALFKKRALAAEVVPVNALKDIDLISGTYAKGTLVADIPVVDSSVTKIKPAAALSQRIPKGYRAVTINVDHRSSVEGWAMPGTFVDVSWTAVIEGKRILKTIVENARILSTQNATEEGQHNVPANAANQGGVRTVTLLTSKMDSKKIQFASTMGELSLSLRGDSERGAKGEAGTVTLNYMLGVEANARASNGLVRVKKDDGTEESYSYENGRLVKYPEKGGSADGKQLQVEGGKE
jgi:Flp pilus assembly protein CpaB